MFVAVALIVSFVFFVWRARSGTGSLDALGDLPRGVSVDDLNLLVVTLDTTRADRLGPYGGTAVATPHLDALARRGVVFERAVTPAVLTLPAHSSIFTGHAPGAHGVRDNGGFYLGDKATTLAEILAAKGFATGGFVSAYVLDRRWGIAQGFDRYFDDFDLSRIKSMSMGDIQRPGDATIAQALSWLDGLKKGGEKPARRFFGWVHLYDPHAPYSPPEPYASQYPGKPYNGEIAWTDALVGRLVDGLAERGLAERTVVMVLADHGESLGEHGETGHGFFLYEPTTRIPFLLAAPYSRLAGVREPSVVRSLDLLPTALDLLGLADATPVGLEGQSLVPRLAPNPATAKTPNEVVRSGYSEAFYSRFHYGWSELRAVRTERWHFIEAPRPELYDLDADPGETVNLATTERRVVADLRRALAGVDRIAEAASPNLIEAAGARVEEDEETLRKLAALGYVGGDAGGASAAAGKSFRDLPDPKDRVEVYNWMSQAREALSSGRPDEAITTLGRVLARDSEVIDAWFTLANAYFQKREWSLAGEAFKTTLAKKPDHDYAMIGLADTLVARGEVDDAIVGYRRFLSDDPKNAQIQYRFAQVLLDAGRDDEAEQAFLATLAADPRTARAEVGRSVLAFRRRDFHGARAAIDRALAIDPSTRYARYNLALILEAEGKAEQAIAAYESELVAHPDDAKARFNLGRLRLRRGDLRGGREQLTRAVQANPEFAIGRYFLAQANLEAGDLDSAVREARRALELAPTSEFAPLGHYVLADVYNRQGRSAEARREVALGRAAESAFRRPTSKGK